MGMITSNVIEIICKDCGYVITPKEYLRLHPFNSKSKQLLNKLERLDRKGIGGGVATQYLSMKAQSKGKVFPRAYANRMTVKKEWISCEDGFKKIIRDNKKDSLDLNIFKRLKVKCCPKCKCDKLDLWREGVINYTNGEIEKCPKCNNNVFLVHSKFYCDAI